MCLNRVRPATLPDRGLAWKVFRVCGGQFYPLFSTIEGRTFPARDWVDDPDHSKVLYQGKDHPESWYHTGFHCLTNQEAAHRYQKIRKEYEPDAYFCVRPVEYERLVCQGSEDLMGMEFDCLVARRIRILSPGDGVEAGLRNR